MKLVITTQIHENYGAHNWDGEGECPQYWKAKGGENYVVQHLTPEQAIEATKPGGLAERLGAAVTVQDNPAFEEYVLGYHLLDNDEPVGEEWETPWIMVETDIGFYAEQYRPRDHTWSDNHPGVVGMRSSKIVKVNEADDYEPVLYVYEDGETKTYNELIGEAA
tara:strand:+ start:3603 stop:4094 length:492 start_codon:yes stop_codon:yes gene_type:complete